MNTAEDRIINQIEGRPRLSRLEVAAKAVNNEDAIIRVISESDPIERPGLMLKLYKTVSMAAYARILTKYYGTMTREG